ncbi:methyl-accepting chemotaxis protein [Aquabacterium sp.]|uniref:methyl-accepting chemotaxis protein n=1 Tax=Aquabacterium sp. TaxID=1872578 RepID=UPI003784B9CF
MEFLNNLRLRTKFAVVALMAVAMTAAPATLVLRERLQAIAAARAEAAGIAPAGELLKLIRLTQQHRGLSAATLAGNTQAGAQRVAVQAELANSLQQTEAAIAALGQPALDKEAATMRTQWQPLADALAAKTLDAPASFSRHTALVDQQLDLLRSVVDQTALALDGEPAAHALVGATLADLPRLTEALGQLRARGNVALQQQAATLQDKARLEALASMARLYQRNATYAFERMAAADAAMGQALNAAIDNAARHGEAALALLDSRVLRAETLDHPAAAYFASQTQAIDAQFQLVDAAFGQLARTLEQRVDRARATLAWLGGGIALLGLLCLGLLWQIARATARGIDAALQVARTVASGDLGTEVVVRGRDETGELLQALKTMNDNLGAVVRHVRQGSEQIATGAGQIAVGNTDLSQRTEEQASNLQQTAASMEQLGASVKNNAESARQAAEMAQAATQVAQQGGAAVSEVVQTMEQISAASRRIGDIIGVIDGIAFQTNILALNAAVEAARAGEQGRGFAVVAAEVRSLAQRSAQAAREIKTLIHASAEQVDTGARQVADAGATMQRIVLQVQEVDALVTAIGESTQQQAQGIAQVGDAMSQLDEVTQQNAALVEESAAAADSMHQQASRLVEAVGAFRLAAA